MTLTNRIVKDILTPTFKKSLNSKSEGRFKIEIQRTCLNRNVKDIWKSSFEGTLRIEMQTSFKARNGKTPLKSKVEGQLENRKINYF